MFFVAEIGARLVELDSAHGFLPAARNTSTAPCRPSTMSSTVALIGVETVHHRHGAVGDVDAYCGASRVAHHRRLKCRQALAREMHCAVIAKPCHVDAQALHCPFIAARLGRAVHRRFDFLHAQQRIDRARRELPQHVRHHPRVFTPVSRDLLPRPFDVDARRALRIVRIRRDRNNFVLAVFPVCRAAAVQTS